MPNFIGLDIGTTSIKAVLLDTDSGKVISSAKLPTPVNHKIESSAEHDPEVLYQTITTCLRQAVGNFPVHGLSISSFAEAGLPLDEDGKPLFPIIAWFDPRSQPQVEYLLEKISEEKIFSITGQKVGFSFGLLKFLWISQNYPEVVKRTCFWLSVPDYVLYRLTGKMVTDFTQASRTLMFNQKTKNWSDQMVSLAGLIPSMLPDVVPSGTLIGEVTQQASDDTGLPAGLPCCVGGHDHLCGAFACGGMDISTVVDSSGSSQAVMVSTREYQPYTKLLQQGYVQYIHVLPEMYTIKGGLKAAGKAIQWLKEQMNLPGFDLKISSIEDRPAERPVWLPFFQGSGTPNREPFNRAALFGLTLDHTQDDIAQALLEGFAYWLRDNLESLSGITKAKVESVIAIGGTNQIRQLQMIKANVLNLPITVPDLPESSAVGAALLAAAGMGAFRSFSQAQKSLNYTADTIEPNHKQVELYSKIYNRVYLRSKNSILEIHRELNNIQNRKENA